MSDHQFYVYTLAYPDGTVFYVGKGSKSRIMNHEADAMNRNRTHTYYTRKSEIIRQIWHEGGQVLKQKVAFFDTEDEAYAFEKDFIKALGKEHLINLNDGGNGCKSLKREKVIIVEKAKEVKPEPSLAVKLQRYTSHARHRLIINVDSARKLALLTRYWYPDLTVDQMIEYLIEAEWQKIEEVEKAAK